MLTRRRKRTALGVGIAAIVFVACLDSSQIASPVVADGGFASHSQAPFGCQIEFTEVSTIEDEMMASYDMPSHTDTSYVCATWTGSDYRVYTEELGSSVPVDMRSQVTAAAYDGGVVTTTATDGNVDPQPVGSSAFDMGLATAEEMQASYEAPFYGVYGGGGGGGGGDPWCDPEVENCDPPDEMALRSRRDLTAQGQAAMLALRTNPKPHGLNRRGTRRLTSSMAEIGRGANGHRRFRRVDNDVETIVEMDPATELMSAHETRKGKDRSRAEFTWRKSAKGGHVRDRMRLDVVDHSTGKPQRTSVTIRITGLRINGKGR